MENKYMEKKYYVLQLNGVKIWYASIEAAKIYQYERIYDANGVVVYSPYEGE